MERNHADQGARTCEARPGEPHAKTFSGGPTAATETRPTQTPNFAVLSTAPDALAEPHVVVVRHLATVEPTVAPDPRQMRLTAEPGPPVVRTRTPERRFCIRCKVKPRLYTMRPVPAWERG